MCPAQGEHRGELLPTHKPGRWMLARRLDSYCTLVEIQNVLGYRVSVALRRNEGEGWDIGEAQTYVWGVDGVLNERRNI